MTTPNTVNLQVIHDGPRNAVIKAFLQSAGTQSAVAATATLTFTGAPVGDIAATATLTFTGAPTAAQTFVLNGVTFTARASGATGDEFDIGGTVTETADNVVAAVNGSASVGVDGVITASNVAGVVTFTADVAGAAGNSLTLTEALSNATRTIFAGGADGEIFVLNGVTFMAKNSGASGDQFDIGGTVTETADNVVAAVNGSVSAGVAAITASNVAGVVTFTADVAGAAGNSLTLTEALTNATRTIFAGGADAVGELADQIVVDVSALSGSPSKVHLASVQSRLRGFDVLLEWEATTDKGILTLTPELVDELDFSGFGGIPNNAGTGVTGDISITTVGFGATTDVGWILLEVTKD